MNVFISWSGEASKTFALAVNNWLKQVLQKVTPWMSDAEIGPGERWNDNVSSSLSETNFGIICVTPESLTAPWVLFEAGALAKAVDSARVVPLLFGVKNTDLISPLAQFQALQADKDGFFKLAAALNIALKKTNESLEESVLISLFRKLWPDLDRELKRVVLTGHEPTSRVQRSERELLGEVLDSVRRLERTVVPGAAPDSGAAGWQDYYIRGANLGNNLGDPVADLAALRAYSEAIVLAPRDMSANVRARLYAHRGAILKRLKRLDEAENDISFALKWANEDADVNDAMYHMASIMTMKGNRQGALGLLGKLAARDPRWLGLVQAREDYFPKLLQDPAFKKLVRKDLQSGAARPRTARFPSVSTDPRTSGQIAPRRRSLAREEPKSGAGVQREPVTIACFNQATISLGVNFDALIAAMQEYVTSYVAPVWGTPAKLVKTTGFQAGAWSMVFLDNADEPGALAYHDLTPDGLPCSKVFVKATLDNHDLVSVSASHQLVEMLVDPQVNKTTRGPDAKLFYACEVADPVEALSFDVNGIAMSDFIHPAYFEDFHKPGSVRFDHLGKVNKPFQILSGGYQIIFKNGKWTQVFGSPEKAKRFAKEDRRGHRSERRAVGRVALSGAR